MAVNGGRADVDVRLRFDAVTLGSLLAYRTSETESLRCLGAVELTGTGLVLPAQSVTTFVAAPIGAEPSCPG